ncbi:ribonuclease III [Catenovulum sp. SM1970]|uniref:ribonuclease III n=1 Tax=Marinifaba aquimaris TaxID=2741323 RepID=UPI0015730448|nr:ribonuclease III [Marinifaba aquimaris]NTS76422.1 ribonuclease III [Marinifaba aquimaris]
MAQNKLRLVSYKPLYQAIGYQFNDQSLLVTALTHRSAKGDHNERLEFLGDSILSYVIAEVLFEKFPRSDEGELTRMRSTLVRGETLTQMANDFGLSEYLILGPGEMKSGGKRRSSILEDAFEAIIGAIYLDSDMVQTKQKILDWYQEKLATIQPGQSQKDSKTQLQEWLQQRKHALPVYEVTQITGQEHNQTFTVSCSVDDLGHKVQAKGTSRRKAEQEAARLVLQQINQAN